MQVVTHKSSVAGESHSDLNKALHNTVKQQVKLRKAVISGLVACDAMCYLS